MCGIIAYKGKKDGVRIVLDGLRRLEYRGYDSWGIAVPDEAMRVVKNIGKVGEVRLQDLAALGSQQPMAIGHSRWATTGAVTVYNAHPHLSNDGRIALVHNGIVENYRELKAELLSNGFTFASETDSEVVANLIEYLRRSYDLSEAIRQAFLRLHGRNALVVMDREERVLVGIRYGSPLIVGIGEGEYFLASDVPAFLDHTRTVNYLDDYQMVVLDGGLAYFDVKTGAPIERRSVAIDWSQEQAEKGEYPYFMIKEIMEQKDTIRRAVEQDVDKIESAAAMVKKARGTFLVGCGTSGKVCHVAEYFFNEIAHHHTNFVVGSEFSNFTSFLDEQSLMVTASQSGETADVLEAMEEAKKKGVKILSLVNVRGSSIMNQSDQCLLINAGPEQAVASTKATTAQLSILALLAYATADKLTEGRLHLVELAGQVNDLLNPRYNEHILKLAELLQTVSDIYIIGRGVNYPLALECAIKLQEVSYIHGEGFAGGELKHGPLALIRKDSPVIVLVAEDQNTQAILTNAQEVKARGGYVIGVSPVNHPVFDYWLRVPDAGILSPIVNIIPVQMLAYHLGVLRGNNPDKPRNLAKSVTVK
ncbi:MAG: glutamine--fructose-6-phosphate transaminase (isomerizing) [Parcubacteria group bacterium]|nr:glutamine--fructose-6-phosphate transaminase (isomerizing) [Parcubacteria group bacterium]